MKSVIETTKYATDHQRLKRKRGSASQFNCVEHNTIPHPATQWAHIHDTDPADPDNYQPMCARHHVGYDANDARLAEMNRTPEHKERVAASNRRRAGFKHTPETIEKMREARRRWWAEGGPK